MTTQVPVFLKGIAALVRRRIAANQAVHVTEQTAKELELLAELPWDEATLHAASSENGRDFRCDRCRQGLSDDEIGQMITPADIALGWLLASRALPEVYGEEYGQGYVERASKGVAEDCQRAAICAELAVLTSQLGMPTVAHVVEPEADVRQRWEKAVAEVGMGTIHLQPLDIQFYGVCPHEGTREGARAAWAFIVEAPLPAERAGELAREMGYTSIYPFAELAQGIGETYRRELEATK